MSQPISENISLPEFLTLPIDTVRSISPSTMILTTGGTRRSAVMHGVSSRGSEYARWTLSRMIECFEMIFSHGVDHLITTALAATNFREQTPGFRDKIVEWTLATIAGTDMFNVYKDNNWRVRAIGAKNWSGLEMLDHHLREATVSCSGPTIWYVFSTGSEDCWRDTIEASRGTDVVTREDVVHSLLGEVIPPATLYVGFGKPQFISSLIPAALLGDAECYWRQSLGFEFPEQDFRKILYDFAFVRDTWRLDKRGREDEFLELADSWNAQKIVGIGSRLGPFWQPK